MQKIDFLPRIPLIPPRPNPLANSSSPFSQRLEFCVNPFPLFSCQLISSLSDLSWLRGKTQFLLIEAWRQWGQSEWIPRIGMEFETTEEIWNFWRKYAGRTGFNARKCYNNRSLLDRKTTSRAFVYSNEGFHRKDKRDDQVKYPRDETRTGCQVRLVVKLIRKSNKYEIIDFINEHNHMLQLSQVSYLMPCQRKVSYIFKKMLKYKNIYGWNTKLMNMQATDVAASNINLTINFGIQPKVAHEFMSRQASGVECI
jgi:FAR1 DNA-binding domain